MPAGLRTVTSIGVGDRPPLLEEIENNIAVAAKDIGELIAGVRDRADSIFGSQPEASNGIAKSAGGSGRAMEIREKLSWLHESIATLRSQLQRLNAL